jgi:hypothetical protein
MSLPVWIFARLSRDGNAVAVVLSELRKIDTPTITNVAKDDRRLTPNLSTLTHPIRPGVA